MTYRRVVRKKFLRGSVSSILWDSFEKPREDAFTQLARIGNKVSVEISYGGLSHKIG